ncbi:chlorophyllase-2-like [Lycium ferocissimum]|uniref:chlorophyllase-2-like n=1 Tax=Lycium ferocissimum TaxID=112874 RepID=UPI002815B0F9|nr:chlorophyllase-2-like [Lycium ferocissimum]
MEKVLEEPLLHDASLTFHVFEEGDVAVKITKVKKGSLSDSVSPSPSPLLVVSPIIPGKYPVLLFFHGFILKPSWYKSLLQHISSHRCIVVAPQFSSLISQSKEVKKAAKVTEWLSKRLNSILPEKVKPDLLKIAVSGHSRGGKTAFSLALGYGNLSSSTPTPLKFQALLGIDPVAGSSPSSQSAPKILQYIPRSFDQSVPVAVIGTGLSNQRAHYIFPPFAPNGVNHSEFFNECKPPCYYFLAKDYGHTDILDDKIAAIASLISKSGKGSKDLMRKAVGGIVVAFLEAKLGGQVDFLNDIVKAPSLAPITLDPVIPMSNN